MFYNIKELTLTLLIAILSVINVEGQVDRSSKPEPGPAPKIHFKKPTNFVLNNGLKVYVIEDHKLPKVTYSLSVDRDPIKEGNKAGYISAAGNLMDAGTKNRTKDEINSQIDFIGATLSTSSTGMYGSAMTKHTPKLLKVMSDVLQHPTFPKEELDKYKKRQINNLRSQKEDPNAIANRVSDVLNFGKDHPYGEVTKKKTINNIKVKDLKKYYNTYYKPNISYLVIVGDITVGKAKKQAKKYFGDWKKAEVPEHTYIDPILPPVTKVGMVHRSGAVQSVLNITHPVNLKPGSEDAIPAKVMNSILGGGQFSGNLQQTLREDKAYTYGARSVLNDDEEIGYFKARASVRNEVTDSAITTAMKELRKIRKEKTDKEHLELVKNSFMGKFARSLESKRTVANFYVNIDKYNLPKDYYNTYLEKVEKVSREDVQKMAKKYIKPDKSNILVVGNEDSVLGKLKKFGKVNRYDIYGNKKGKKKEVKVPKGLTGKKVVKKYLDKIGGIKKLNDIKTLKKKVKAKSSRGSIVIEEYYKNNKFRSEQTRKSRRGSMTSKKIFDGEKAKTENRRGSKVFSSGEKFNEVKREAHAFPMLHYLQNDKIKINLVSGKMFKGKKVYEIKTVFEDGSIKTFYFDKETGLKVGAMQSSSRGKTAVEFADYKKVEGVKFPHKYKLGQLELNLKEIKLNPDISDKLFSIQQKN